MQIDNYSHMLWYAEHCLHEYICNLNTTNESGKELQSAFVPLPRDLNMKLLKHYVRCALHNANRSRKLKVVNNREIEEIIDKSICNTLYKFINYETSRPNTNT